MYQERMIGYYPQVLQAIREFKAIVDGEYPEFEDLNSAKEQVINNAYLATMDEGRVKQWENFLGITPLVDSTLDDRRDTVMARIRGQGKLNTNLINSIVKTFTGGTANSWVKDSVLYVEITPPPNNKQYKFANVEQELRLKVPAHMGFQVSRNYYEWNEVKQSYSTWQDVKDTFDNWNDVRIFSPFSNT
jgi:hypothetical protein